MKLLSSLTLCSIAMTLFVPACTATQIPIGYVSFVNDSPLPGQSSFNVVNATGTFGCDPLAQVCDDLNIDGTLTVTYSAAPGDLAVLTLLTPLAPGFYQPPEFIQNDTRVPIFVTFSGTVSPGTFSLFGGSSFSSTGTVAGSSNDVDLSTILLYVESSTIPEPSTGIAGLAVAALFVARRILRQKIQN